MNYLQKINLSEMFRVEHKTEFELLIIYEDKYPLLELRKIILFILK